MARSRAEVAADIDDARAAAFNKFLVEKSKELDGGLYTMADERSLTFDVSVIPTGVISVDVALGCGGFPKGMITELYGNEGGGKSTLALTAAAECTKQGGPVLWVDSEGAFVPAYAKRVGVVPRLFVPRQPQHGEEATNLVEAAILSGGFDMIVIDSVAALWPREMIEGDIDSKQPGRHAKFISNFLARIVGSLARSNVTMVLINQLRMDPNAYGNPEKTTGGRAIKFYSSVRIDVRSSSSKKLVVDGRAIGQEVAVKVAKNRCGPPYREASFNLIFGRGIDTLSSVMDAAVQAGVLEHPKGSQTYKEVATGVLLTGGKDKVKAKIAEDNDLRERLVRSVYEAIAGQSSELPPSGSVNDEEEPVDEFGEFAAEM